MTIYALILVLFVDGSPTEWTMRMFLTQEHCKVAQETFLAAAKEKDAALIAECREVKPPPATKAKPPEPKRGSNS